MQLGFLSTAGEHIPRKSVQPPPPPPAFAQTQPQQAAYRSVKANSPQADQQLASSAQKLQIQRQLTQTPSHKLQQSAQKLSRSGALAQTQLGQRLQRAVYALNPDATVKASAEALAGKNVQAGQSPHRLYEQQDLHTLGPHDKLTIVAHGNAEAGTVGGLDPKQMAAHLKAAGLKSIGKISLKSCDSTDFALKLKLALTEEGIAVQAISARSGQVNLSQSGHTLVNGLHQTAGHKIQVTADQIQDPYRGQSGDKAAVYAQAGLHGSLGPLPDLLQQAHLLHAAQPDKALEKIQEILSQVSLPADTFYALHATQFLCAHKPDEAPKALELIYQSLLSQPENSLPQQNEYLIETGKQWLLLNQPHAANSSFAAAATAAQKAQDHSSLLQLAEQYAQHPGTQQESIWCAEQSLLCALSKMPDPKQPAALLEDALQAQTLWARMSSHETTQAGLQRVSERFQQTVTDMLTVSDLDYLRSHAQSMLELGSQLLAQERLSPLKTVFPADELSTLAQKTFQTHQQHLSTLKSKPAEAPEIMAALNEAQMLLAALTELGHPLSARQAEQGARISGEALLMNRELQSEWNAQLTALQTRYSQLSSELPARDEATAKELAKAFQTLQVQRSEVVEQLLQIQETLLDAVFVMARSRQESDKEAALQQLTDNQTELHKLLQLPPDLSISLSDGKVTTYPPVYQEAVLSQMIKTERFAVSQHQVQNLWGQLDNILKAEKTASDRSLFQATNQLVLEGSRYLLSRTDNEKLPPLGSQLLQGFLPRLTQPEMGCQPEDILEIAGLLQSHAPETAAKLLQPLAQDWLKQANATAVSDPEKCLEKLSKSLDAVRTAPDQLTALMPQINEGLVFVIQGALAKPDTELLRQAMQMATVYVPANQLAVEYPPRLIAAAETYMGTDPVSSFKMLRLAAHFAQGKGQTDCAQYLIQFANQALQQSASQPALAQLACQSTEQLLQLASKMRRAGNDDYLKLAQPLNGLITGLQQVSPSERVQELIESAEHLFLAKELESKDLSGVFFQPGFASDFQALTQLDKFKYATDISKATLHKQTTVIHYRSDGHPPDTDPTSPVLDLKIDKFVQVVARKSQLAYEELKNTQFLDWDKSKGHYARKCLLKSQWDQAKKACGLPDNASVPSDRETQVSAVFYDQQRLLTIGKKGVQTPYDETLAQVQLDAETGYETDKKARKSPLISIEDRFLAARIAAHANPTNPDTQKAAEDAVGMLSTLGGYLIEERTYQLLKADAENQEQMIPWLGEKVSWTDQDTDILGGTTRPDLTLKIPGEPLHLLMDFTAFNSQGHIYDKTPSWTGSKLVADAVEILYPSMSKTELKSYILEGKALSDEEIKQVKQAYAAEQALIKARQKNTAALLKEVHNLFRAGYFDKAPELQKNQAEYQAMGHLCKRYGLAVSSPDSRLELPDTAGKTQQSQINLAINFYKAKAQEIITHPDKYKLNPAHPSVSKLQKKLRDLLQKIDPPADSN